MLQEKTRLVVNLDAAPLIPYSWSVEEHQKGGQIEFDPAKITLYLSKHQEKGKGGIKGDKLREELKAQKAFNANLLDWLLRKENHHLIPEAWRNGKTIFFWGTVYRNSDGSALYVRYLYGDDNGWHRDYRCLSIDWSSVDPAAVLAS